MADMEYDVTYLARSPASMKQDDFAEMVDELCNGRAAGGWRLFSSVGDYGARVTLGMWLIFTREAGSASDQPDQPLAEAETDTDEAVPDFGGLDDDGGESQEPAEADDEESTL